MAGDQVPSVTLKAEALHALLVARLLFEKARETCFVDERHMASAGLTILQDGLELVLYGLLIQLGVDEKRSIENLKFDDLLGLLKSEIGSTIPKSGTLKALNKQRNLIKHAGQLADPLTVRNFYENSLLAIDGTLFQLLGRRLQDVASSEMVIGPETKQLIADAERLINERDYFAALSAVRKVLFIEVLQSYAVDGWLKTPNTGFLSALMDSRGLQAPFYAKNAQWIEANVKTPYDYVQLDTNALRLDLSEWGVSSQDFWNLMRLTPRAFRYAGSNEWEVEISFPHLPVTEASARFCLDRILSLVIKKQSHFQLARFLGRGKGLKVVLTQSKSLYEKASTNSKVVKLLDAGSKWQVLRIVGGLDGTGQFLEINDFNFASEDPSDFLTSGYVLVDFPLNFEDEEKTNT